MNPGMIGVFIPIIAVGGFFAWMISLSPLGRALAERIRPRGVEAGLKDEIQMLRDDMLTEVQQARHEIAELGERMDFAERLLAKRVEP